MRCPALHYPPLSRFRLTPPSLHLSTSSLPPPPRPFSLPHPLLRSRVQPVEKGVAPDRIMATELEALWTYSSPPRGGYEAANERIFATILASWGGPPDVGVYSLSLQQTAYNAAERVLNTFPEIDEVLLTTPNIHFYTYPLEQFGLSNPNLVFQSTDCDSTASGRIETRLARPAGTRSRL